MDCEEWRVASKLDEAVPTWDYPEKEELMKYYLQYYHKTDKVRMPSPTQRAPPPPSSEARPGGPEAVPPGDGLPARTIRPRRRSNNGLTHATLSRMAGRCTSRRSAPSI